MKIQKGAWLVTPTYAHADGFDLAEQIQQHVLSDKPEGLNIHTVRKNYAHGAEATDEANIVLCYVCETQEATNWFVTALFTAGLRSVVQEIREYSILEVEEVLLALWIEQANLAKRYDGFDILLGEQKIVFASIVYLLSEDTRAVALYRSAYEPK